MKIIGHRGARGIAVENTKASFLSALEAHVDGIEFDLRTCADGNVIVNHDPDINGLAIAGSTYQALLKSKPDLLTLAETLQIIGDTCQTVIEIKKGADISVVVSEFKKLELPKNAIVSSFDFAILKAVKAEMPAVKLCVIEKWSGVRGSYRCRKLSTKYLTMNQRWLWFGFIMSMAKSGYKLSAYSLNDPNKAKKWAKHGLYAAVTDRPDLF